MVVAIDAPFALLEKPVEIAWFDAIKSAETSLGLIRIVMKVCDIESIASLEHVGVNNASRTDLLFVHRKQGLRPCVGRNGSANLPTLLEQAEYGHFPGCFPASLSFPGFSEITLTCLGTAVQFVTRKLRCDEYSQPHIKANGRVQLHPDDPCNCSCRCASYKVLQKPDLLLERKAPSILVFPHPLKCLLTVRGCNELKTYATHPSVCRKMGGRLFGRGKVIEIRSEID
jgi:hypothetical protein